jgi:hypothetical protein
MPYIIKERHATAGVHIMYLLETPLMSNSIGLWTVAKKDAERYDTIAEANIATRKLNLMNRGVVAYYSPKEVEVSDSDWVIKSNITNEYLVQAQIFREIETWSHTLKNAKRFKTAGEAREYTTNYIIGKPTGLSTDGQALDMDYIPVPKERTEASGKNALFRNTIESDYHFVIRCNSTLRFLEKLVLADRTADWVPDIREAKQYKYRTAAETTSRKINCAAVSSSVHVVDSKTHKIVQNGARLDSAKTMPEKRNYRVQMCHGENRQIEVTYPDMTEIEALNKMFAEAKKLCDKPFISGKIRAHPENIYRSCGPERFKSM